VASRLGTRLVLALGVVTLLAACATIPDSGPVRPGATVLAEGEDPIIRVVARPPTLGMAPAEIVRGFLSASASAEGDHAVARQFLTPKAAQTWQPDRRVVVYDQNVGITLHEPSQDRVLAQSRVLARIDSRGTYRSLPATVRFSPFRLQRVSGQWRISSLPQGLLLTQLDIDRSYRAVSLYFLNATGDVLVPDPIYLPVVQPGLSTRLTQSLLDGPTPWLAPSVATAFPAGTQLVVDSVPVENGVAHVDLSSTVLEASAQARGQLAAQLVWTLSELSDVNAVSITVQGQPLPVGGSASNQTTQDWTSYDPGALPESANGYLVAKRGLVRLFDTKVLPVEGYVGSAGATITDPAVSSDASTIAVLSPDRSTASEQFSDSPGTLVRVATGTDFARPQFDSTGLLWLVDRTNRGSTITVVLPDRTTRRVRSPLLREATIQSMAVSRDGSRVAVVIDRHGHGRLLLGRVERLSSDLNPNHVKRIDISGLHPVEFTLDDVRDVCWADADHIALLARAPGAARQPYQTALDGTLHQVGGALPGLETIAAAPGLPLLGGTHEGKVWRDSGTVWRFVSRGTSPVYPG
jgi:hypothetical protein